MTEALEDLERRVLARWAAAAAERTPDSFDVSKWSGVYDHASWLPDDAGLPPPMQFPREQWVSYPAKRRVSLMLCDRMLDFDVLTDEQWMLLCMTVQYGGKERIA